MFSKLALKNVSKSIKDYTVYFLTMTFGVCLFYIFNSIDSQTAMLRITKSQYDIMQTLSQVMGYVSIFISIVLGFLIVYANQFLIKRRKKELGVYMTLGMNKGKISYVLILETFLIGVLALVVGLVVGIFASQGLSVVTAKMFETDLKAFQFIFSPNAFYKTILYFSIIFVIVMVFNTLSISKFKLIDLLTAGRKNENLRIKKLWVSVVLFFIACGCLGTAYYLITKNGMLAINLEFTMSIVLGSIGTLLFFLSLSGFLLRVIQTSKKMYFKNLNMFVLRQINSKINTTFVSMSVICIMLLVTIGTLSTGMGLSNVLKQDLNFLTPYDVSFTNFVDQNKPIDIAKQMQEDGIDNKKSFKAATQVNFYRTGISFDALLIEGTPAFGGAMKSESIMKNAKEMSVFAVSVTDFNHTMKLQGKPGLSLKGNEFAINCNQKDVLESVKYFLNHGNGLTVKGKKLVPNANSLVEETLEVASMRMDTGTLILPDEMMGKLECIKSILNVQYAEGIQEEKFTNSLHSMYKGKSNKNNERPYMNYYTKIQMYEQSVGLSTIVSFIAIYIGLVFLITSAAVLALQQLSEASDNVERYGLLKKLGAESKMINHALLRQIAIYFMLPLGLAVVHSAVGIHVANNVVQMFGQLNIVSNTVATAAIILFIYGAYFMATYISCKGMLRTNKNN